MSVLSDFFANSLMPSQKYITERFLYEEESLNDDSFAVAFSKAVITDLFGFDQKLLANCMLFSELQSAALTSGFHFLWCAVFDLCKENNLMKNSRDSILYKNIFNYQTGKLLAQKAEQLVVRKTVYGDTAKIVFKSCVTTQGESNFEGYANFDFITALSIFLLKDKYPHIHTVKANVYLGGMPAENFPVVLDTTVDQRHIYGLINSR